MLKVAVPVPAAALKEPKSHKKRDSGFKMITSYNMFCEHQRPEVRAANPNVVPRCDNTSFFLFMLQLQLDPRWVPAASPYQEQSRTPHRDFSAIETLHKETTGLQMFLSMHREVESIIGSLWKEMSVEDKQLWKQKASEQNARVLEDHSCAVCCKLHVEMESQAPSCSLPLYCLLLHHQGVSISCTDMLTSATSC